MTRTVAAHATRSQARNSRSGAIEDRLNGLQGHRHCDTPPGRDGRGHRGYDGRGSEFKGNAQIPERPPRGTEPSTAQPRQRGPVAVERVHLRGGVKKPGPADVAVHPHEQSGVNGSANGFPAGHAGEAGDTGRGWRGKASHATASKDKTPIHAPARFSNGVSN